MTGWNNDTIRELERNSIRAFVESCSEHLTGRVLDYGCGLSPYKEIVEEAGGEYVGFDREDFPANVSRSDVGEYTFPYQTVLCTQVVQYLPAASMLRLLSVWAIDLASTRYADGPVLGGHLILTGPTTWPLVEPEDLCRFTPAGARALCEEAGFAVERCEPRGELALDGGLVLWLGWGIVARA